MKVFDLFICLICSCNNLYWYRFDYIATIANRNQVSKLHNSVKLSPYISNRCCLAVWQLINGQRAAFLVKLDIYFLPCQEEGEEEDEAEWEEAEENGLLAELLSGKSILPSDQGTIHCCVVCSLFHFNIWVSNINLRSFHPVPFYFRRKTKKEKAIDK